MKDYAKVVYTEMRLKVLADAMPQVCFVVLRLRPPVSRLGSEISDRVQFKM